MSLRKRSADLDSRIGSQQKRVKTIEDDTESIKDFLSTNEIVLHDANAPPPCMSFDSAPFSREVVRLLKAQFKSPTPIQAASWPLAALKRDVLAIAKTGSGKTLGFLLPALMRCSLSSKEKESSRHPICLVMAPTRELAIQIHSEAEKFGRATQTRSVALYGGAPKAVQARELWKGCDLVVATPGRMKDMLQAKETSLERCKILILDEADRMLDMGFEKDIREIIWQIPEERQTLFYSATWPPEVERIAGELLKNPSKVTVGSGGEKLTANKSVTQHIHVVDSNVKMNEFLKLLEPFKRGGDSYRKKVIVFANTKADVNRLSSHCWRNGFDVDSISGDRSQPQRESVIKRFRDGSLRMVIATDVCGRGLDIDGINRVVNYDFPSPEDYIHRIGRTGRGGTEGRADSFFTEFDKMHAKELVRILTDAGQVVPKGLTQFAPKAMVFEDSDSD